MKMETESETHANSFITVPSESHYPTGLLCRDGQIFIRILILSQTVQFPNPGWCVWKLLCKYMYRSDSGSVYEPFSFMTRELNHQNAADPE